MGGFEAMYEGTCVDCGGHIGIGDLIVLAGSGGYAHVACPPSRLDLEASEEVCAECFLVKPCACQDGQ